LLYFRCTGTFEAEIADQAVKNSQKDYK